VTSAGVTEEEVNSETAVLLSDEVLRATVREARLAEIPLPLYLRIILAPFRFYDRAHAEYHDVEPPTAEDRAVRALGRSISMERLKASNVMVVTLTAGDPAFARDVLNLVMRHYLDHHLKVHARYAPARFFNEQLSVIQDSVTRREGELISLKRRLGVIDLEKERQVQIDLDLKLREEAASVSRRIAEIDGLLTSYRQTLASVKGPAPTEHAVDAPHLAQLRDDVLKLSLEQIRLESRFNDGFPLVVENKKKLDLARASLAQEEQRAQEHSPTLRTVDQEIARLDAERLGLVRRDVVLSSQIRGSRERLGQLDGALPDAERVQRDIKTAERRYEVYLTSSDKSRVEMALDQGRLSDLSLVQAPAALTTPEGPKKWMVLLIAFGGGILNALLVCFLLELRSVGLVGLLHAIAPEPRVGPPAAPGVGPGVALPGGAGLSPPPTRPEATTV
jgi:uncharacterized protein involved in exopolysaccharide biosynthesis